MKWLLVFIPVTAFMEYWLHAGDMWLFIVAALSIIPVAALMGETRIKAIYDHAIRNGSRFFSYGDSSLLIPGP